MILVDPYPRTLDQIFSSESRRRLEALGPVTWHDGRPAGPELVEPLLPELVAIVGQTALPAERLERAPRLRTVVNVEGNFLPNVDYGACFARGSLGHSLLPLLEPFRCEILGHDPWLAADALAALGVEPVGLVELFRRSRVVFVLSPVTTENAGAIGRECFDAMPGGSVVVLVSRAGVVDWRALLDAAASGRIRAAIDVFPDEPIPAAERARTTPGTILSAHRAGNVPEIWRQIGEMVADDLEALGAGRAPSRLQRADPATVGKLRSRPIG